MRISLLLFNLLLCSYLSSQCPGTALTLNTQMAIDNFAATYPGCTGENLVLTIRDDNDGADNITDLSGLSVLNELGFLEIVNNQNLASLNGLSGITSISTGLDISNNPMLTDLSALGNLSSINGDCTLNNLPITTLSAFASLTNVGGGLTFNRLNSLVTIAGTDFPILSGVGFLYFTRCENLTAISGFNNLVSISNYLNLYNNAQLSTIDGFNDLTTIGGFFQLWVNRALLDVSGFSALSSIGGYLRIEDCEALPNLNGWASLTSIGGYLQIKSNDALTNFNGLSNVSTYGGTFIEIRNNLLLESVDGLIGLTSLNGDLIINGAPSLNHLLGLANLSSLSGDFRVVSCPLLMNFFGLEMLVEIGGDFMAQSNNGLTNFSGLTNLLSVLGGANISNNPELVNLSGLNALNEIGSQLTISYNNKLSTLNGLNNLSILGGFSLQNNPVLIEVQSLNNVAGALGNLRIDNNDQLLHLDGLNGITFCESLIVFSNKLLENINGLSGLQKAGVTFRIVQNNNLKNLNGLSNLTEAGTDYFASQANIGSNPMLEDLSGLENLQHVITIVINNNINLKNIDALSSLSVESGIFIQNNPELENVDGLTNIENLEYGLYIENNDQLKSLAGLTNLMTIGIDQNIPSLSGGLRIIDNDNLKTLEGLNCLTRIYGGILDIKENDVLSNIDALGNLLILRRQGFIHDNPLLSDCCSLISLITASSPGTFQIYDNLEGCNSDTEVLSEIGCQETVTVTTATKISELQNTPPAFNLSSEDAFGAAGDVFPDLNDDGRKELIVGASGDDGQSADPFYDSGAAYLLFLNNQDSVASFIKWDSLAGIPLSAGDRFGESVAYLGDIDGDGIGDVAVGAPGAQKSPDQLTEFFWFTGAVYILFLNSDGSIKDYQLIDHTSLPIDSSYAFGTGLGVVPDLDGNDIPELAAGAVSANNETGLVYLLFLNEDGEVINHKTYDQNDGLPLEEGDRFGRWITTLGDLDGDGNPELVVGAVQDDDGGPDRGAFYTLFLDDNQNIKSFTKVSDVLNSPPALKLMDEDKFARSGRVVGDLDGNCVPDIAVGASLDDDGGTDRGAVYILFMEADGSASSLQKISQEVATPPTFRLQDDDRFGHFIAPLNDLDHTGNLKLAVGSLLDDAGGTDQGAVHLLSLEPDALVRELTTLPLNLELAPGGENCASVTVQAADLVDSANGICLNENVAFSFSVDPADTQLEFTCQDIGIQEITIYALASTGVITSALANLEIMDNGGFCPSKTSIEIDEVFTENATVVAFSSITSTSFISSGVMVDFKAGSSITLQAGFQAVAGSQFRAFIEPDCDIPPESVVLPQPSGTPIVSEKINWKVYPNPVSRELQIVYSLPYSTQVQITLSDINGRPVAHPQVSVFKEEGNHTIRINNIDLPPGWYSLTMQTTDTQLTERIVVIQR